MNYDEFKRGWRGGLPETSCGSGSKLNNTAAQREWIPEMVAKYGIKSIADIGSGDLNWAQKTEFGCKYTPYDLIPSVYGVKKYNLLTQKLPKADCLMVLWVLNHLTEKQALAASRKIAKSQSRYLFVTYRDDYYNFIDATVLESIQIFGGAELRLIEL